MKRVLLFLAFLGLVGLACKTGPDRTLNLYPTATNSFLPTQTPYFVEITTTPHPTYTPLVVEVSSTPVELVAMCVTANEAVYLRPAPNSQYYPIDPLPKGTQVMPNGARDGDWIFVSVGNQFGWVKLDYLGMCD